MDRREENTNSALLAGRTLTDGEFRRISSYVYRHCKLNLHEGKKELVLTRLAKRLRTLNIGSFDDYMDYVEGDPSGNELTTMVDALTTNMTYFFRENDHFEYLAKEVFPNISGRNTNKFRVWSAGCSSGEEPYTIAMLMREHISGIDFMDALVLATDISTRMLQLGVAGEYSMEALKMANPMIRNKYFELCYTKAGAKKYRIHDNVKKLVRFRKLNLMDNWPIQGKFDIVFCRNVMIYFDKPTQQELMGRFYQALSPGGLFMVGHSESLAGIKTDFEFVGPMIYRKP